MISEQTVLMQLNWLSRDSVGKTVFYFFFQWQLENRIITIAPVVSFIWSLKTVIYSSLWLGDRNFVLTQKLLASPKKIVINDTSDLQSANLFFHLYMLLTLSHVPCMCCMSHGGCVVITLHVSYFAALFLWISHLMLLVLQLFSSMSYIPFKHFGKLCPFLLWHYYLSFFKHTFPYFF